MEFEYANILLCICYHQHMQMNLGKCLKTLSGKVEGEKMGGGGGLRQFLPGKILFKIWISEMA